MTAEKKPAVEGTAPAPPRLQPGSQPAPLRLGGRGAAVERGLGDDLAEADPARDAMLAAQRGDTDAFRRLLEMFQDRVMRVMTSVLHCDRGDAEDLTQEVFLRVHKGLPAFDGGVRFVTWLHSIAMNVAISDYRRRRAQKRNRRTLSIDAPLPGTEDLHLAPPGREVDPGERAHQREFLARVRACVGRLPEEFRAAVVLRDMESLGYEEIAAVLDLPIGTVRSRIHRGRLLLQAMLQEFG
ncbi:MAG: sigma-70 family RNA polymerase sigma factor [Planctomycetes bacterium]|nr:sigma-70 family RNA polymerase sigma factor [Planctomycetota bacterium]